MPVLWLCWFLHAEYQHFESKDTIQTCKIALEKHGNEFDTYTSALDEYDSYFKEYIFRDDAIWYEAMRPTYESVEVEIKKM